MLSYKGEYKQPEFDSFLYKFSLDYPFYAVVAGILFFIVFCIFFAQYMTSFFVAFVCLAVIEVLIASVHPIIKHFVIYHKHTVEYTFEEDEIKVIVDNGENSYSLKYNDICDLELKWMENRSVGQGYYLTIRMNKRTNLEPVDLLLFDNKSEVIKLLEDKVGFKVETQYVGY